MAIWMVIFGVAALLLRVGFALQGAGLVRSKNAAGAVLRITADTAVSAIAFWAVGAAILLQGGNGFLGFDHRLLFGQSTDLAHNEFFHLVIFLIGGAIITGALAERSRFYIPIAASIGLTALVIPIA